jgi:hypothetical protein
MHTIRTALIGVGMAAVVLSGCAAGTVVASDGREPANQIRRDEPATTPTSYEDMSDEEALAFDELATAQGPLGIAAGEIEEQYPEDFAYAFFEEATLHVGFKAAAPEDAVARLAATEGSYVVIEEAGFNTIEYLAAMNSVSDQVHQYTTVVPGLSVGQTPRREPGAIVVSSSTGDPWFAELVDVEDRFRVIFERE